MDTKQIEKTIKLLTIVCIFLIAFDFLFQFYKGSFRLVTPIESVQSYLLFWWIVPLTGIVAFCISHSFFNKLEEKVK